ncbi:MAG: carboxypeptidase-like regulatory domain-containing protein [Vicinamibacterales bacterium]
MRAMLVLASVLLSGLGLGSLQDQTGAIAGRVTERDGRPLPGVSITVTSATLRPGFAPRVVTSRSGGDFRVDGLPPGTYRAAATLVIFETVVNERIDVAAGRTTTWNVVLEEETR